MFYFWKYIKKNRKIFFIIFSLLFFLVASIFLPIILDKYKDKKMAYDFLGLSPEYAQAFSIINDTVSQNANIVINLPYDVTKQEALDNIKFTPEIEGSWEDSKEENELIFNPSEKLALKKYYTLTLNTKNGVIGKDFLVEEDPKVLSVFPKENSETHEESNITIIFNRPMVPLTTLDIMVPENLPIEITPKTEGKFKWIGTKSLQFIPENKLIPSSNYSVRIKSDFKSMDGLSIDDFEHNFTTRHLRYNNINEGQTIYNQPIRIYFNQAVDLEKTKKEIWLKNTDEDKRIDFLVEYGTKKVYNEKTKKYEEEIDQSVLEVFNEKDRHGRKKLWDFKTNYFLHISKAYALQGDIVLDEKRDVHIQVTDIISSITSESERSSFVKQDFFDPHGKIIVNFYEEINLDKSKIKADKLVEIKYGEKCKQTEENFTMARDLECEKIPDKTKLYFTFDKSNINYGEELKIRFEKIYNIDDQKINTDDILEVVKVIPELKILNTKPVNNGSADLTELILCTNTPLVKPDKEDVEDYLKLNLEYEFKRWNNSIFIYPYYNSSYYYCGSNQFETRIQYGLMPESDYSLNINLIDNFGNTTSGAIDFRTQKMPEHFLNFYHFQDNYTITKPGTTKLTYAVENMDYVNMHICKLEAVDMLNYLEHSPQYIDGPESIKNCIEESDHTIQLEKKYWLKNYFQVDLKDYVDNPFGHYMLTFSHPDYKEHYGKNRKVHERNYISITNLAVTEKEIDIENIDKQKTKENIKNLYWVVDLNSLEAIANAQIETYYNFEKTIKKLNTGYTDENGIARVQAGYDMIGAVVTKGEDSAIISKRKNYLRNSANAYTVKRIYTYTDRPIYRPTQTVHIKGLYRVGFDGAYEIMQNEKINLKVINSKNEEIFNKDLLISEFGTFNTDLELDKSAPLGRYRIQTEYGSTYFEVEEYVPAPFKVESKTDKEEYLSGDIFNLDIDASYYFGAPLEGGEIEYSIGSQDYHFDKYTDEYFQFGSPWYYCYGCNYNDKFILRNKIKIDNNGKAHISHKLDFNNLFTSDEERVSKIFVVYMTVKNQNGQAISAQKSFIVHNGEFYLGLKTDKRFIGKDEGFITKLKSVDTEGNPIKVKDIDFTINKIEWIKNKRKEVDGGYYYKWEEKLTPVINEKISSNNSGDWNKNISIKEEGSYKIIAQTIDSKGNKIKASYNLYVYGEGRADIRPSNDTSLEIEVDKEVLNVGENAQIIIKSPYEKAKALVSIERGEIFSYEIVDVSQGLFAYSFPIEEKYIPNVYTSVTLLSDKPELKHGEVNFRINTTEKELNIDIKSDKEEYLPGEDVILDISAKDSDNKGVEAELSIAVADLSVLALKGNVKKDPLIFFYNGFPLTVSTASNLNNVLEELEVAAKTKGGGGAEASDLAKKKRGIFKDTALWEANVVTDKNGKATVKFTLPDNLTTWQIESIGLTKDTKLGVDYKEFIARKELMLTPLNPRFIVPGDEFSIGAKIFNQSDTEQNLEVSIFDTSLEVLEESSQKIKIPANESGIIYFKVKAPISKQEGSHNFILSAKNKKLEDTVEKTIKITKNTTYEATATSGYSKENLVNEYVFLPENVVKDQGELKIQTSATMAVFLSEGLNYLLGYPYGCSEQISSKLQSIAIIKRGLNLKNIGDKFEIDTIEMDGQVYTIDDLVEIGLEKIYKNQKSSGGFAYYPDSYTTSFYLSLHIAQTLVDLEEAGYYVDEGVMRKLLNFLNNNWRGSGKVYYNRVVSDVYVISQMKKYGEISNLLKHELKNLLADEAFLKEEINNVALTQLAILSVEEKELINNKYRKEIFDTLENRIDIDSRGAFLDVAGSKNWEYYETTIKDTGLLLKALTKAEKDNAVLDRILRWLLRSRDKDGSWGSTNNTITVIDALTDYLVWQEENKSDFILSLSLNDEEKISYTYNTQNILNQDVFNFNIYDLGFNQLNKISFNKTNKNELNNNFYYDVSLKYYLPANAIPPRDEGFTITRKYYRADDKDLVNPVRSAKVGDVLKSHIELILPKRRNFVSIEDYIPAGVELINFNLATENKNAIEGFNSLTAEKDDYINSYAYWRRDNKIRPDFQEFRDDRLFLFKESLEEGTYEFDYYVRVLIPGKFNFLPAIANEMYFPENFGRTDGGWFVVNE